MPKNHIVEPGDCIASIAFENGFAPATIWRRPENEKLRADRPNGNVLVPGDVVFVPDLRDKAMPCATTRRHRFRRKGIPEKLKIQLLDGDKPRAGLAYVLEIDGVKIEGTTDAEGKLEHSIAPDARRGTLVVGKEKKETYELDLGHLEPVTTERGARARLHNLGFLEDEEADAETLARAIGFFQAHQEMTVTSELDDATRTALGDAHKS